MGGSKKNPGEGAGFILTLVTVSYVDLYVECAKDFAGGNLEIRNYLDTGWNDLAQCERKGERGFES